MLSGKLIELNWNNYKQLQSFIDEFDNQYFLSSLNLLNWGFYDIKIFFKKTNDALFLYSYQTTSNSLYIFRPLVFKKDFNNIKHFYKQALINIKDYIEDKEFLEFFVFNTEDTKLFKNIENLKYFNSAYVYKTEKLKYMKGKKMQKKRNFVNRFTNSYEKYCKLISYEDKYFDKVIEFCKKHSIDETTNEIRIHEIESIKMLLKNKIENSFGSILFFKDEIIGFTYGVLINSKIFEIFVEKANDKYKGSFQYLLSKNLQMHNINCEFVDRQDDMDNEKLAKSKKSYRPDIIFMFAIFKVKNIK